MELVESYLKMIEKKYTHTGSWSLTIQKKKNGWDYVLDKQELPQDLASKYLRAQRNRELMKYMRSNGNGFKYNIFC